MSRWWQSVWCQSAINVFFNVSLEKRKKWVRGLKNLLLFISVLTGYWEDVKWGE